MTTVQAPGDMPSLKLPILGIICGAIAGACDGLYGLRFNIGKGARLDVSPSNVLGEAIIIGGLAFFAGMLASSIIFLFHTAGSSDPVAREKSPAESDHF
jgi:hypothetical protein